MADQNSPLFDKEDVERRFRERQPTYKRLEDEATFVLGDKLDQASIKRHSITSRIKTLPSLLDKAERQQLNDPLSEMNDIVGLRVVCLFLSDIEPVGQAIRDCFDVIKEDNKIEGQPASSFGYMSVHFVARMKKEYKGPRYDLISDIPFEIQVRTIAMDAWAAASHYLDYKTDVDIPKELRRDFYALSGLFYVADRHFETFAKEREKALTIVEKKLTAPHPELDVEVNLDSLTTYLRSKFKDREHSVDEKNISNLVQELRDGGVVTIKQLDEIIDAGWDAFLRYEKDHPPSVDEKPGVYIDIGIVRVLCSIASDKFQDARKDLGDEIRKRYATYRGYVTKKF
jgi:putative GTP pyrophosphokinase